VLSSSRETLSVADWKQYTTTEPLSEWLPASKSSQLASLARCPVASKGWPSSLGVTKPTPEHKPGDLLEPLNSK
jgi:hypothetical protein